MKTLFTFILISFLPLFSAYSMGESTKFGKTDIKAGEAYAKLAQAPFQKLILDYNRNRKGPSKIASSLKKSKDRAVLEKFLVKNGVSELPPIKQVKDKAYISIGKSVIAFSILSVRRGEFYLNNKLVKFDGSDLSKKEKAYSLILNKKPRFSIISLFISEAYAESGVSAKLDILLVASMMKVTKDFEDRGLCAMCGDENSEQMKANFDKMISNMDSMANDCENKGFMDYSDESEVGRLAYSLNNIQEYNPKISDDSELNEIIDEKFKALESDEQKENLTCGHLAAIANKEEIEKKFLHTSNNNKNVFAGYLGSLSEGRKQEKVELDKYISEKCDAHSRLLNCLATNSDYGRAVYNRDSGRSEYKKVVIGRDLDEGYQNQGLGSSK